MTKKQNVDLVLRYWVPWQEKTKANRLNFFRIEKVPPDVVRKLMTGWPNVMKSDRQNFSPTVTTMVKLCEKYNGTLEGYVIPVESGRDDARISFDGFILNTTVTEAKKVRAMLSKADKRRVGHAPDEFSEVKTGFWRFWWD